MIGYIFAVVNDIVLCVIWFALNTVIATFFIGACMYLRSFCALFKAIFGEIEEILLSGENNREKDVKIKRLFCQAVELHNTIKG